MSHAQETTSPVPAIDPRDAADRRLNPAEPDFTVVNLPTTLRLPRHKSAFRIAHRFTRTITNRSFGDLAGGLFGLDSGAFIGLEYRFGLMRGLQAGVYRTSDKTIQFFGQYDAVRQSATVPFTLDLVASVEGLNNFHRGNVVEDEDNAYATALGLIFSRTVADRAAFYLQPSLIVMPTRTRPLDASSTSSTAMMSRGASMRPRSAWRRTRFSWA